MKEFNNKLVQEQFDKMNQLDRIEFRQKRNYLEEQKINVGVPNFLIYIFVIIGFVFLVGLGAYQISPESASTIMNMIPSIFRAGFVVFIGLLLLQVLFALMHLKKKKELFEEYFKINFTKNKK
jgi:uncharacterized membrane protein